MLLVDMLASFDVDHRVDEGDHLVTVEVVERGIGSDAGELAHSVNILGDIVLGGRSPRSNDLGDGGAMVVADIAAE